MGRNVCAMVAMIWMVLEDYLSEATGSLVGGGQRSFPETNQLTIQQRMYFCGNKITQHVAANARVGGDVSDNHLGTIATQRFVQFNHSHILKLEFNYEILQRIISHCIIATQNGLVATNK